VLFIRYFTDLARAMLSIPPQFNPSFCVQKVLLKTTASPLHYSQWVEIDSKAAVIIKSSAVIFQALREN
jgi:hypothetical protein